MQITGYFALLKHFNNKVKIHLYFDSEQIGTVDFNKVLGNNVDFERRYNYNRSLSYRCPVDVCLGCSKAWYDNFVAEMSGS